MSDLLTQLHEYGHQLDDEAPPISFTPPAAVTRPRRLRVQRPWAVVTVAAVATLVLLGAAALLVRGDNFELADPIPSVPETWTTWTASDGIPSDCACEMAMASDGSIWIVGWDGIARYDGTGWERIEPPQPFTGEGWPAVAPALDGSVWVLGMSYIAQYVDGTWGSIVEAGFQEDGGPLTFQGLEVDDEGLVWTNLADVDGVISDGGFVPRDWPKEPVADEFAPPEGVAVLTTAPDGSIWMGIGDSIIGVDGALIQYDGQQMTAYDLGGVREAVFEADGTGWFTVNEVGSDAWMYGKEQWSNPGLYRHDSDNWYRITIDDGLAGYKLSGLILAPDGALWLATTNGTVTRYQPGTDPHSGSPVDIATRPFTEADWPPPMYPPPTYAGE